jgi:hypothetical protein
MAARAGDPLTRARTDDNAQRLHVTLADGDRSSFGARRMERIAVAKPVDRVAAPGACGAAYVMPSNVASRRRTERSVAGEA